MEFQVLPAPAKALTKSNLKADNCLSVQVACIPLCVELFDGEVVADPVPTLFAADLGAVFGGLMDNAAETLGDIYRLNSRFLYLEHVSMEDAVKYLQGPARRAKGVIAFPEPSLFPHQPAAKKPKTPISPVLSMLPTTRTRKLV